jgi:3-phosphoshikimate 1-carboxyvinyltransferase
MDAKAIMPFRKPFAVEFTPPGSKSLTNRALVLAALAKGKTQLSGCLLAEDTLLMMECLKKLGFEVEQEGTEITVVGLGGEIPVSSAELFCGNSGTTIRFLAAMCSLGRGRYVLDGIERMRSRPIGQLGTMLKNLGVRFEYLGEEGFPPVAILGDGLPGGISSFGNSQSSQFLSAILQVCPYARHEVKIDLEGAISSWPYIAMTMGLMDHFHCTPELYRDPKTAIPKQIIIPLEPYQGCEYAVEPDASNASYFLALAAIHPGSKIRVMGLGKNSRQGDVGFADVLHQMGAGLTFGKDFITVTGPQRLTGVDVDLTNMPDVAQTLAVTALFAQGETTMRGLGSLRVKETDRILALTTELRKLGAEVEVEGEDMTVWPVERFRAADIATYNDHRMAMSFALAGTRESGIRILDPGCCGKTYPGYFEDLEAVGGI